MPYKFAPVKPGGVPSWEMIAELQQAINDLRVAYDAHAAAAIHHGALTGLGDDDHAQYLTVARHLGLNPYSARWYDADAQQVTAAWVAVALDSERVNNGFTLNANKVYANQAGYYIAGCSLSSDGAAHANQGQAGKQWNAGIRRNGTDYLGVQDFVYATSGTATSLYAHLVGASGPFYLNGSTDYCECIVMTNCSDNDGGTDRRPWIGGGTAALQHIHDVWIARVA